MLLTGYLYPAVTKRITIPTQKQTVCTKSQSPGSTGRSQFNDALHDRPLQQRTIPPAVHEISHVRL